MCCFKVFLQIISIIVVLIITQVENKAELTCDSIKHPPFHEGNLGQTGVMPWLGVIRAHMLSGPNIEIAVTGAILIKPKHALANANDMSKIRKKGNSKAMFISNDRGTWTCKLSEVAIHPEYEFATYNTIALVELDTESLTDTAPMLPVCMATYMYNTSNQLYAFGFTDENKLLEKVAYKVQYVERALCDEFYKRAGHDTEGLYTPQKYECAFAENNNGNCEWENGMALASNVTGHWVLIGFGVQGPGCSAPARFIDVYPYLRWIDSASNEDDFDAEYPFKVKARRSDSIESIEHFDDNINTTNYLKRDRKQFNMTFREFLKEYYSLNKTRLKLETNQITLTNDTLQNVSSKDIHETSHMKRDNTQSEEFESENKTSNNTSMGTDQLDFENRALNAESFANHTINV